MSSIFRTYRKRLGKTAARRPESRRSCVAETIAIGSELLLGGRSDSNSHFITDMLGSIGIEVRFKAIVGDKQMDILDSLKHAVKRADVVVMTGGLGPTVDDRTREAVADATGQRLNRSKEALDGLAARLGEWGRTATKGQLRQAMIPSGSIVLPNPIGSAPGFLLTWKGSIVTVLPGVPCEMEAMMRESVLPLLAARIPQLRGGRSKPIRRVVLHTWGLPEAEVDAKLQGLLPKGMSVDLGLLASPMGVLVSLTTKANRCIDEQALASLTESARVRLGEWLYAEGNDTMEQVVGRLLMGRRLTLAVAESCTGGLIGHRLTQVPGSSAYIDRGAICYSNRAKTDMLGVPEEIITKHGAVSLEVAAAMAKGIRERAGVSVGLSVTGIAGPGGATDVKPIGLVYVGLDGGAGGMVTREFRFHGDRSAIKQRSSQAALDVLRRWLCDRGGQ